MTSPLLEYANSYLLIAEQGIPEVVDGRVVQTADQMYLVQCYLKRQDSTGTSTGADYIPLQSGGGNILGASGQVYLYRGYALRYTEVDSDYDLDELSLDDVTFVEFDLQDIPQWMDAGQSMRHRHGNEKSAHCTIKTSTGKFGNTAIDELINENIGGIPLVVYSGQVLN